MEPPPPAFEFRIYPSYCSCECRFAALFVIADFTLIRGWMAHG
jgi:hypothetical protein